MNIPTEARSLKEFYTSLRANMSIGAKDTEFSGCLLSKRGIDRNSKMIGGIKKDSFWAISSKGTRNIRVFKGKPYLHEGKVVIDGRFYYPILQAALDLLLFLVPYFGFRLISMGWKGLLLSIVFPLMDIIPHRLIDIRTEQELIHHLRILGSSKLKK